MRLSSVLLLIVLAMVVVSVGVVYTLREANSVNVTFTYQRATERADGTPLPLEEIKFTRLFCNGQQVAEEAGADGEITVRLEEGYHSCYMTHVDNTGLQSAAGNLVKKYVQADAG